MHVKLNGDQAELPDNSTITAVLLERNLKPEAIVIELNGDVLDRSKFGDTFLKEDDTIEIVHFVGGG